MPERTKNHILHAFNRLVQKKNFDKITIENICQEAEVGRTTFYRYFTDKYDLLDYSMYCTFHEHQNDESIQTFRDIFYFVGQSCVDQWRPLATLYDSTAITTMHNSFQKYSEEFTRNFIEKNRPNAPLTKGEEIQLLVIASGCGHLFENYTRGKLDVTPDEIAEAVYALVPDEIKCI